MSLFKKIIKSIKKIFLISCFSTSFAGQQLDSEYNQEFTDIVQYVYGKNSLSQGRNDSLDLMLDGIQLNGKKLLDIGSGLGGSEFYLAKKYSLQVTGVDRVKALVDKSLEIAESLKISHKVKFLHIDKDNSLADFPDEQFDIIFSKESLLHVNNKQAILNDAYRVLKPGGKIVILDWLVDGEELGPNIKQMMKLDNLDLEFSSTQKYKEYLSEAGFRDIQTFNMNRYYIGFTEDNLDFIKEHKKDFIKKFGKENYEYSVNSWNLQKRAFENKEVIVSKLIGIKMNQENSLGNLKIELFTGSDSAKYIDTVSRFRTQMYKKFPYLYLADYQEEREYMLQLAASNQYNVAIAKRENGVLAGVSSSLPLSFDSDRYTKKLASNIKESGGNVSEYLYLTDTLVDNYDFDIYASLIKEQAKHAKSLGLSKICAIAVIRDKNDYMYAEKSFMEQDYFKKLGFKNTSNVITYAWPTLKEDGSAPMQDNDLEIWEVDIDVLIED